jgi:phosphoenolpyruvate synthase/pyruvate phosphate dikinase
MTASGTESGRFVAWLGAPDTAGAGGQALGGKAASLNRLARLGFTVPPAFCLTTEAFRTHLAAIPEHDVVVAAIEQLPDEEARTSLVRLVGTSAMPAAISKALSEAIGRLLLAAPSVPDGGSTFAVRSSGIGEDGAVNSYAGLHETELGLHDAEIEPAVRRCWASLWSAPAVGYGVRRGHSLSGAAMAVVVQILVPADAAAVVFTRHPVTNREDQLLINAIHGLGEPMVSGTATPDTIVVDKASRAVTEFTAGDPGERLVARDGGVARVVASGDGPALSEAVLSELIDLSLAVEQAFGAPVDIEAARAADCWYLLQARPITTR